MVQQFLGFHGFSFDDSITGVAISSGVPRVTAELRQMTERYFGFPPLVLEPGVRTGMPILYDNPKEVGADRIANAVGAYDLYGGPSIVVDFGTATTIEAVSDKGEYLGGAIFPGVEISMDALFGRAAGLRRVELVEPKHVIGKSSARVDPVGHDLRLQRAGRRARRPLRRRARAVRGDRNRWSRRADHPAFAAPCSTTSRGSRCTVCGSSSKGTSDRRIEPQDEFRGPAREGRGDPRRAATIRIRSGSTARTRCAKCASAGTTRSTPAPRPTTSCASRAACC